VQSGFAGCAKYFPDAVEDEPMRLGDFTVRTEEKTDFKGFVKRKIALEKV
jgi:hypothetical protein